MESMTMNDVSPTTNAASGARARIDPEQRDFDVLIIGAGLSGVGAAHHLLARRPGSSFALLEAKPNFGGTWRTHTYPGARSDSDFFTFGYSFKPWIGDPIARADQILDYLEETIADDGLEAHIRYDSKVERANWSSARGRWELEVSGPGGAAQRYSARFLWMCQGYYDHDQPHVPEWPDMAAFKGPIIHPQQWPADLDYRDKRVVVIGSGATAATLIPSLAEDAALVTMLQRSPSYFHTGYNKNDLAETLRALEVPDAWTHEIVRRAYLQEQREVRDRALADPEAAKVEFKQMLREHLGPDFDIETHFTPSYQPFQQRIAYVPDGDFFKAINKGKATIVTDRIERFTERGLQLASGAALEADIVVTATGFNLSFFGDIPFAMDGEAIAFPDRVTYRGLMVSGVPNLSQIFGYLGTAWTMRVDLCGEFVYRLLDHMDAKGATIATPTLTPEERAAPRAPLISTSEFSAGYIARGIHKFPRKLDQDPWRILFDYYQERDVMPAIDLDEPALVYL